MVVAAVRSLANDRKATFVPSGLHTGCMLSLFAVAIPPTASDTTSVVPDSRSRMNTSVAGPLIASLELF